MSRNLVVIVSSILFVALAGLLVAVPVNFVTWRPGSATNVLGEGDDGPVLEISGAETHETTGELLMTTVSASRVDSRVSFPEALFAHLATNSDAMPREVVYPPGRSSKEVRDGGVAAMDTSRDNAAVAALRAAGQQVAEMPMVDTVNLSGPSEESLKPGDLIESIDGKSVTSHDQIPEGIRKRSVGEPVVFKVIRDGAEETITVVTESGQDSKPVVGITLATGYLYAPEVNYNIDSSVVGPSAGLVFALAIYDQLTPGDLLGGTVVGGTGEIDAAGEVSKIGGVHAKIASAEKAGAEVFLLPEENCSDVADAGEDIRLVPVSSLRDAIAALQVIKEGHNAEEVPSCE